MSSMRIRSGGALNITVGGEEDEVQRLLGREKSFHRRRWIVVWTATGTVLLTALVAVLIATAVTLRHRHSHSPPDNYTVALHGALLFFDAQKSGEIAGEKHILWRGNSGVHNGSDSAFGLTDLVGGFHNGGDAVKVTFPQSFTITVLSWSVMEYSAKYEAAGELNHVKEIIKWGLEYLLKTFNSSGGTIDMIVSQVGSGNGSRGIPNDGYCWMRPEDIDYARPVTACSQCADIASEMAAALAAASLVFKEDRMYSKKLISGAQMLFKFRRGKGRGYSIDESETYKSTGFYDEYVWGATWIYLATGDDYYLKLATNPSLAQHAGAYKGGPDYGVFSWDNKLAGAQVLLTRIRLFLKPGYPYEEILWTYHNQTTTFMCSYLPVFTYFNRTKGGLIQLNHGGPKPLQYVVNAAFLATLFSDYLDAAGTHGWHCGANYLSSNVLREFAKFQIDYILGNNPQKMSYVVGFGDQYPLHVHHRAASIPYNKVRYDCEGGWQWRDSSKPNPNVIEGAMVGGPDIYDVFEDLRNNSSQTEPTIAGNAGLVAALVVLSAEQSANISKTGIFSQVFPPPPH